MAVLLLFASLRHEYNGQTPATIALIRVQKHRVHGHCVPTAPQHAKIAG